MRNDTHGDSPGTPVSPNLLAQMGYETRDVLLRPVIVALVTLFFFIFLTLGATAVIYSIFIPNWAKLGRPAAPPAARRLPPHPQLQAEPKHDMALFRRAEDRLLNGTEADSTGAKQTMTIDQAMDTIATQRGIAGVTGTTVTERGNSGPGQGHNASAAPQTTEGSGGTTLPDTPRSDENTQGGHGSESGGH
jgi:hypothetical protein